MHLHGVSALHRCASQITVTNENAHSMVLCSFAHAWTSTTIINCNPCKSPWNGNKTTWNVKQIASNFARFYLARARFFCKPFHLKKEHKCLKFASFRSVYYYLRHYNILCNEKSIEINSKYVEMNDDLVSIFFKLHLLIFFYFNLYRLCSFSFIRKASTLCIKIYIFCDKDETKRYWWYFNRFLT